MSKGLLGSWDRTSFFKSLRRQGDKRRENEACASVATPGRRCDSDLPKLQMRHESLIVLMPRKISSDRSSLPQGCCGARMLEKSQSNAVASAPLPVREVRGCQDVLERCYRTSKTG